MTLSAWKVIVMGVVGILLALVLVVFVHRVYIEMCNPMRGADVSCTIVPNAKIVFDPTLRIGHDCDIKCIVDRFGGDFSEAARAKDGYNIIGGSDDVFILNWKYNLGAVDAERSIKITADIPQFDGAEIGNQGVDTKQAFYLDAGDAWLFVGSYSYADHLPLKISFSHSHGSLRARLRSKFTSIRRYDGLTKRVDFDINCPVKFEVGS